MNNILFDLDGTLTDPFLGITNSIAYALQKLEVTVPADLKWCIGPPLQDSFAKILHESKKAKSVDDAIDLYREYFSNKGIFENEIYLGIENCLKTLTANGKMLFVATSKPNVYAKRIIEHFELTPYFKKIYGSELGGTRKEKGNLIKYILEKEELESSDCIMIGDRKHDLIGANLNEVASVGVTWGYGSLDELKTENPKTICTTIEDLKLTLLSLTGKSI